MPTVSFSRRVSELAAAHPDNPAVTSGQESLSWAELDRATNQFARVLMATGVLRGDTVAVVLPNGVAWFVSFIACWKAGAIPLALSAGASASELMDLVALAEARVVIALETGTVPGRPCLRPLDRPSPDLDGSELEDRISPAWKSVPSGGSTGRPKLIVSGDPGVMDTEAAALPYVLQGGCLVMPGPLYHNGPLMMALLFLLADNHVVALPRFEAEATLAAVEAHEATALYLVPTMMRRIWRLPEDVRTGYDLQSLQVLWHLSEPCPRWLKEAWIDWLGAQRIVEFYGGSEAQALTMITGEEWLSHPGSVGRPIRGKIKIGDEGGRELAVGQVGEVWLRWTRETRPYHYIGATPRTAPGGWESLGDLGYIDDENYLYLCDRLQDMILVGGANVYPAEVEAVIQEHPLIRSCAVIGLPDEDLGNRVHAIVQGADGLDEEELRAFVSARLIREKRPRTFEFVDIDLRDDAGKVRRSALRSAATGRQHR